MAIMSDADRALARRAFVDECCTAREALALTRQDLIAAINAADQWCSDNAGAFNTAIPQPARGALTAAQKARLFRWVVYQRFIAGA